MAELMPLIKHPELVFGLVGPIGVELEFAQEALEEALKEVGYEATPLRITDLMRHLETGVQIKERPFVDRYESRIAYANELRRALGRNDIMAALAVSAIRRARAERTGTGIAPEKVAYTVRQFKTPEEISLMRAVYGRQFVQVSIWGSQFERERRLISLIREDAKGRIEDADAAAAAKRLILKDAKEDEAHGQNIRDCFPLGDVFIEGMNKEACKIPIRRFINALFGNNSISPTHDEYGMYLAKSASLRSSDLSRQVGAAIFSGSGEVIALGSNEVPKAGGGTYWTGDRQDARDFVIGSDPNESKKREIVADLIAALSTAGIMRPKICSEEGIEATVSDLLDGAKRRVLRNTKIMDLLEFGRIIHAEMSALCDAARTGRAVEGATLYATTFPYHICAKHIVASGILEVVYLEPYPKSYAKELHDDAIEIERRTDQAKILFRPFIGISPYRYRDLFEKGRRKYGPGKAQAWHQGVRRPMIESYVPTYLYAEDWAVSSLAELTNKLAVKPRKQNRRKKS